MPPRLLLYSYGCEALDDRLLAMLPPKGARVGYLPSSPDPERAWFRSNQAHYARLGVALEYFGLEEEFDPGRLDALFASDAIHLSGGNTFQFLYWLQRRDLISRLRRFATAGGILIGVSAGAIMFTPTVMTSFLCGDIPYPDLVDLTGFALTNFAFVPHYVPSESADRAIREFSSGYGGATFAVPDGSGIVVDESCEFYGPIWRFEDGAPPIAVDSSPVDSDTECA